MIHKVIFLLLLLYGVCSAIRAQQPDGGIHFGTARIYGSISSSKALPAGLKVMVTRSSLFHPNGYHKDVRTTVKPDGSFELAVPLETRQMIAGIGIVDDSMNVYMAGSVGLELQKPLHLRIQLSQDEAICTSATGGMGFTPEDIQHISYILMKFDQGGMPDSVNYRLPAGQYIKKEMVTILPQRLKTAFGKLRVSSQAMPYLIQLCKLRYAAGRLMYYKENAEKFGIKVQDPPLSFYTYLKELNLQSPGLFTGGDIAYRFCKRCLDVSAFRIPSIKTTAIPEWIKKVGLNMASATGFSKGAFYELMAVTAYASQINDKLEPFTDRQKSFIESYFNGDKKTIATTLLSMNTELERELSASSHIRTLPEGEGREFVTKLLERYPGKAVLIDFWNTWCLPCQTAHTSMRPVKPLFEDVAFVYIANESSPRSLWDKEIRTISGDHYYMPVKKFAGILESYYTEWIPFYLLFNRKHELVIQSGGFPGATKMQQWLNEAEEEK